jgi:hypothetical protein
MVKNSETRPKQRGSNSANHITFSTQGLTIHVPKFIKNSIYATYEFAKILKQKKRDSNSNDLESRSFLNYVQNQDLRP